MTVNFNRVDRSHVLQALAEWDEFGAETFLGAYGFTPVHDSRLLHGDKTYDSMAILAVAHRYATGVEVTAEDFPDGLVGAVKVLEALGFEVEAVPAPEPRDASEVGSSAARVAWAKAARPVLLEAAGRYRATVSLKQLAVAVQEGSGITTTQPMHRWISDVLGRVTEDCQSRSEPLLSSLCVSVQGSVGQEYADAVEQARGTRPTDPDDHAATERLECYRHWQALGLPRDGGTPLRTAHFTTVRKASAPKPTTTRAATPRKAPARTKAVAPEAPAPKPVPLCPRCFTQVPASGVCDYCD